MISYKAKQIPPFLVMEVLEKAQSMQYAGKDIIHLEIGEPDFDTPQHIKEAAYTALKQGKTKYTHSLGLLELREAIADHYNKKFKVDISPNQVIITSGTSPAMLLIFASILNKGDEVILSDPHYACYPNFVDFVDGKPVYVKTYEEDGFQFQAHKIQEKITSKTKAILINSPSNPTGNVLSANKLKEICEIAQDNNIKIISDEIYQGLIYEGKGHSILEFADNAFVLNGFSKLYAMTGWRLGFAIVPPLYVRYLQKLQQNFFICANSFVQYAGVAALNGSQKEIQEMIKIYNKRRKYIIKRIKEIGFGLKKEPTGAYYVLVNAKPYGLDSLKLSYDLLENAKVAVTPGIDFGKNAEGYIRFSYANSLKNIEEGMDRIEDYLNKDLNFKP
ncbi:MAG: pyridoxal phosphate-dependent aminotransferase [Methanosarcinales archaeon]